MNLVSPKRAHVPEKGALGVRVRRVILHDFLDTQKLVSGVDVGIVDARLGQLAVGEHQVAKMKGRRKVLVAHCVRLGGGFRGMWLWERNHL